MAVRKKIFNIIGRSKFSGPTGNVRRVVTQKSAPSLAWRPASLGVDHGKIFAALEDEVRGQLRYLSEKPLENVDREGRVVPQWGPKLSDP